jgi:hypothetical protein
MNLTLTSVLIHASDATIPIGRTLRIPRRGHRLKVQGGYTNQEGEQAEK